MDYITPIKNQLDKKMNEACLLFMTIGTPRETPRYYNFRDFDMETKTLTIGSTQKQSLFFTIDMSDTNINFVDIDDFWRQFKDYRTNFLTSNFETINAY